MKKQKLIAVLMLLFISMNFNACKEKVNCEDIDCSYPGPPLFIDLIDEESQVNVFAMGLLEDESDVLIVDADIVGQKFTLLQESYLLRLPEVTSISGFKSYQLIINHDYIVTFRLGINSFTDEDCCKNYEIESVVVGNHSYEFIEESATLKIFVELQ